MPAASCWAYRVFVMLARLRKLAVGAVQIALLAGALGAGASEADPTSTKLKLDVWSSL